MPPLHDIVPNTDYMLFKADIRPEWESPANKDGGKWVLTIENKDQEGLNLQEIWEKLLMSITGCTICNYSYINGIVMSLKERHIRFSLWTRDADDKKIQLEIGKQLKEIVDVPSKLQFVYQLHSNALKRQLDNEFIMAI
eukprot:TRINITY_DN18061_c0_g1_i1.p1 TRINITY_DN18061_c0_g1~~TRINITY_DN18061_c0_g1_i1.p1  ORF type:complete len:139 (+),score=43.25 TRINITY_DN18061_c0_g1_i1:387-803(+)